MDNIEEKSEEVGYFRIFGKVTKRWRWIFYNDNNDPIAQSCNTHPYEEACKAEIEYVKRVFNESPIGHRDEIEYVK